jgi:hypothetical protein
MMHQRRVMKRKNNKTRGATMKHESNKAKGATKNNKKSTKERRGEAKLTSFCGKVGSFFVKLSLKEALKKLLRRFTAQSPY